MEIQYLNQLFRSESHRLLFTISVFIQQINTEIVNIVGMLCVFVFYTYTKQRLKIKQKERIKFSLF